MSTSPGETLAAMDEMSEGAPAPVEVLPDEDEPLPDEPEPKG
jgi:predicted RNase H-like HicB family nuclease